MRLLLAFVGLLIAFAGFMNSASAQRENFKKMHDACKADAEKLCPGKNMRSGLGECMNTNEAKLSQTCRKSMQELQGKVKSRFLETHEACKADFEKFCKDVEPGKGRFFECLNKNNASLTPECKKQIHERRGHGRGRAHGRGGAQGAGEDSN